MANGYIPAAVERGCDPCSQVKVENKAFLGGVLGIDVNGERQPISEAGIVDLTFIETDIESAAQRAEQAADEAQTAQQAAENASADAQGSQRSAQTAATAAEIAQEAAETAKTAAQVARAGAETARAGAEAARTAAQTAQTGAQTAQTAAESAATAAAGSATDASASATAAAGSASQAATSATNAASSATAASGSATQASQSATAASSSATAAQTAQTASEAAQTAAEAAQAEAEAAEARIMDTVPDAVADWLDEHITQETGYVIDDSLTVQGAAADAKAVGDALIDKAPIITDAASGAIASFPDGSDAPINSITVNIEPAQAGTGDPSPTNIRPITGWTGANVGAAGKNLWEMKAYAGGGYNPGIGTVWNLTLNGTQPSNPSKGVYQVTFAGSWYGLTLICPVKAGKKYRIFYSGNSTGNCGRSYGLLDKNFTVLTKANDTNTTFTYDMMLDIPANGAYFYLFITNRSSAGATITINNPQIELGETKTDYEPYAGTSYPITWQTEAGTVYGGTLTVEQDGTGTLVADRAYVDLGSFHYTRVTGSINVFRSSSAISGIKGHATAASSTGSICEKYVEGTSETIANGKFYIGATIYSYSNKINIRDDNFTDADLFKASVTGTKLVYPLATPITYTLTAAEMTTLLGQNNWWADTGDVAVEYRADTKLYIDKKLAALVAALS